MAGVCTTCMGTCGNGVVTGKRTTLRMGRRTIPRGQTRARTACFAAVAGPTTPGAAGRRTATASSPGSVAPTWASVPSKFRRASERRSSARRGVPSGASASRGESSSGRRSCDRPSPAPRRSGPKRSRRPGRACPTQPTGRWRRRRCRRRPEWQHPAQLDGVRFRYAFIEQSITTSHSRVPRPPRLRSRSE